MNGVFVEFDETIEARGLEKIKTIGDAYMGGVPELKEDHAERLIYLASIFLPSSKISTKGTTTTFRCELVSIVVLLRLVWSEHGNFSYDLWGDTVNVASRMERLGILKSNEAPNLLWKRCRISLSLKKREAQYQRKRRDADLSAT